MERRLVIGSIVLDNANAEMDDVTEMAYMRPLGAQHIAEKIRLSREVRL